jgi:hypothetical protein
MAAKNLKNGMTKRIQSVKIVRANKLTAKSSDELKTKVVDQVNKATGLNPVAARAMVNWIIRPTSKPVVSKIKIKKAA